MKTDHSAFRDVAEPYALGILTGQERLAAELHLSGCDECRQELADLSRTVETLGLALEPLTPPVHLRARVLAQAALMPQEQRDPAVRSAVPSRTARVRPMRDWVAIAASVLMLAAGLAAWSYRRDALQLRGQLAQAEQRVALREQEIALLQSTTVDVRQTTSILMARDLARVDLAGQKPAPVASGRVFWSPTEGLVFSATNLPPLPPGRVYQLWVVAEQPHSAGVVTPDAAGTASVVTSARAAGRPKAFALTIEPAGGQPAPTGPMFLVGSL